jgi:hypothetical protein
VLMCAFVLLCTLSVLLCTLFVLLFCCVHYCSCCCVHTIRADVHTIRAAVHTIRATCSNSHSCEGRGARDVAEEGGALCLTCFIKYYCCDVGGVFKRCAIWVLLRVGGSGWRSRARREEPDALLG